MSRPRSTLITRSLSLVVTSGLVAAVLSLPAAAEVQYGWPQQVQFADDSLLWSDIRETNQALEIGSAQLGSNIDPFDAVGRVSVSVDGFQRFHYYTPEQGIDRTSKRGDVILTGPEIEVATGVNLASEYRFFAPANVGGRAIVRHLVSIENTTRQAVKADTWWLTDLATSDLRLHQLSSDAPPIETTNIDRWMVTGPATNTSIEVRHPFVTTVWGSGSRTASQISLRGSRIPTSLDGTQDARFVVDVPAASTRYVMAFLELTGWTGNAANAQRALERARRNARSYSTTLSTDLLAGISSAMRPHIVNWSFAGTNQPGLPRFSGVVVSDRAVTLTITPPSDTGGSRISRYQARCSRGANTKTSTASASPGQFVTGLTNGVRWECSARVRNGSTWSSWSNAIAATPGL